MKHFILAAAAAIALISAPAFAALPQGSKAPEFTAEGYLNGQPLHFDLDAALKKGPVVLYFFPAPHTTGCNIEAHLFADSIDKFKAAGATVIGVTANSLELLQVFSTETEHCSGRFPVAADQNMAIAKSYDAVLTFGPKTFSNRTSYVIAPDHTVLLAYTNLDPNDHVNQTLAAVQKWRAAHPQ